MEVRIRSTGQVMYEQEWRRWLQENNGPTFNQLTPEIMELLGVDPVFEGPQAQPTRYQVAYRDGVIQMSDGKWYTKYSVADMDADAIAATDANQANSVRSQRNRLLTESDWTQVADAPVDKAAWATYRQALRDVPLQTGFPWDITWPTQP